MDWFAHCSRQNNKIPMSRWRDRVKHVSNNKLLYAYNAKGWNMITRFDILGSIPVDGLEEQEKKTSRGTAATERVFGHRKHNSESQKKTVSSNMQTFIWTLGIASISIAVCTTFFFSCFVIMASLMHVNESVSEIGREHRMMFDMNVLENIFRILWLAIIRLPFNNKIAT